MAEPAVALRPRCTGCQTELSPRLLVCPVCHRLVHAEELKRLAAEADHHAEAGAFDQAAESWQRALHLLPAGTGQYTAVEARYAAAASKAQRAGGTRPRPASVPKALGALGAVGLFIWKFKLVVPFVATKLPTLLTFAAAFGVYWAAWGWRYALGFLLCLYVHELGHVFAARRAGLPVSSPMFIPGVGAFIRLHVRPRTPSEDGWLGLAGPIAGVGVTAAVAAAAVLLSSPLLGSIAWTSGLINLFNLAPVWQLDGSRAFHALSVPQQLLAAAALGGAWWITRDGLVAIVALVAVGRAAFFRPKEAPGSNWRIAAAFAATALLLAGLVAATHVSPTSG